MIPLWVRRLIEIYPEKARPDARFLTKRRFAGSDPPDRILTTLVLAARNVVCGKCNNGWMSQLQTAAKPVVGPLLAELPVILMPQAQAEIAGWLTMATMVLEAYADRSSCHYTDVERERFRLEWEIPAVTTVWLAHRESSLLAAFTQAFQFEFIETEPPDLPKVPALVNTFSLGPVVFQLLVFRRAAARSASEGLAGVVEPPWGERTIAFGVPTTPLAWPPPMSLDDDELAAFAKRWNPQASQQTTQGPTNPGHA